MASEAVAPLVSTAHWVRDIDLLQIYLFIYTINFNLGFFLDVHMELEREITDFLGTEAVILYSQGFSTISSVIPAFCKRGDIIVADRGVNFAIQKGMQISRSTIRWYDHNDLRSLEEVLEGIERERQKRRQPLT